MDYLVSMGWVESDSSNERKLSVTCLGEALLAALAVAEDSDNDGTSSVVDIVLEPSDDLVHVALL